MEINQDNGKRKVLITGAAHGLGKALTDHYLSEGWSVIATDSDEAALMDLKNDPGMWKIPMDVTSDESVDSAFESIRKENVMIEVLINNAGIDSYFPLSEAPVEMIRKVFDVNLFGGYRVNQVFLPLVKKTGGRIIHISSESLHLHVPFMPYPISKMALEGYAKVLRQELKFSGIDVIIVRPGAIRTQLLENVRTLKSTVVGRQSGGGSQQLAARLEKFAEDAPKNIGKVLDPEVVANFIYNVSQKRRPKAVYKINNSLQLKIAALLPFSLVEKMIRKKLGTTG